MVGHQAGCGACPGASTCPSRRRDGSETSWCGSVQDHDPRQLWTLVVGPGVTRRSRSVHRGVTWQPGNHGIQGLRQDRAGNAAPAANFFLGEGPPLRAAPDAFPCQRRLAERGRRLADRRLGHLGPPRRRHGALRLRIPDRHVCGTGTSPKRIPLRAQEMIGVSGGCGWPFAEPPNRPRRTFVRLLSHRDLNCSNLVPWRRVHSR